MKKKISLDELKVKSFVTSSGIKGGAPINQDTTIPTLPYAESEPCSGDTFCVCGSAHALCSDLWC
jgi:hypothetical protein